MMRGWRYAWCAVILCFFAVEVYSITLAEEYQAPRIVGMTARVPCKRHEDIDCGRKTVIEMELTVLDSLLGNATIAKLPLSTLPPPEFMGVHRLSHTDGSRCMREDYCLVPRDPNWTLTARVSRQLNVYYTRQMLNHIPKVTVMTDSDLTAAGLMHENFTTLPPYGPGVPHIAATDIFPLINNAGGIPACQATFPAATTRITNSTLSSLGICDMVWADKLAAEFPEPFDGAMKFGLCRGAFCPATPSLTTSDRLLQIHELGHACSIRKTSEFPRPVFEIEVIAENTVTGQSHSLYVLHGHGRSQCIYRRASSSNPRINMRMFLRLTPQTSRRGVGTGPSLRDIGGLMLCYGDGELETTTRIQRPDLSLTNHLAHRVTTARHGHEGYLWYPIPDSELSQYGRVCGQYGVTSSSLLTESLSALQDYCYTPGALEACLRPELSPCRVSARLNQYAVNASMARPSEMLPERIWDENRPTTYIATVKPRWEGIMGSEVLDLALVHETSHRPTSLAKTNHVATDVRISLELSDAIIDSPAEDRVKRGIYAQRLDHEGTSCNIRPRSSGGGSLLFRYCTVANLGSISASEKTYVARFACSEGMGSFATGRRGLAVNSTDPVRAAMTFTSPIGGLAGKCSAIGMPLPINTDATLDEAMRNYNSTMPMAVGFCEVELYDTNFPTIAIGPTENITCFYKSPQESYGSNKKAYREPEPDCGIFSDDPRCDSYVWVFIAGMLVIIGVAVFIAAIVVLVQFIDVRKKRQAVEDGDSGGTRVSAQEKKIQ